MPKGIKLSKLAKLRRNGSELPPRVSLFCRTTSCNPGRLLATYHKRCLTQMTHRKHELMPVLDTLSREKQD